MSAYHHKGELIHQEESRLCYRYFPSYIDSDPEFGEFEYDTETLEVRVIRATSHAHDRGSVAALVHKLKKSLAEQETNPPTTIYHIA